MAQSLPEPIADPGSLGADFKIDTSHLITEDGKPVDSFLAEKNMRLLTETLYGSWQAPDGKPFLVAANVGVFAVPKNPASVPDVFLALDTPPFRVMGEDRQRSYFVWDFGKPPDVVIEIVSDTPGGELSDRLRAYERMRVTHYVVFDPLRKLSPAEITGFSLQDGAYVERAPTTFAQIGLGLVVWEGTFEGMHERWLRWCDGDGRLIPTGAERADDEAARADDEAARADDEAARADNEAARAERERARAEKLAARLAALGLPPDED